MGSLFVPTLLFFAVPTVSQVGGPGGNSACAQWCAINFPNNPGPCTSQAAHGGGPCYVCGPLKTSSTEILCSGVCRETLTDNNNCGSCGHKCAQTTESCRDGKCRPISNCNTHSQCGVVGCGSCGCSGGTACHSGQDDPSSGYCVFCAACSQVSNPCQSNDDCAEHSVCVQTCCTGGDFTPGTGTPRCIPPEYLKCST